MSVTQSNQNSQNENGPNQHLWNFSLEQTLVEKYKESWMATISCKGSCDYVQKAFFRSKARKCPRCQVAELQVNNFNQRNALVSEETETFALNLFRATIKRTPQLAGNYFAKRGVVCEPLGLDGSSGADLAILNEDKDGPVSPSSIKCLFEIKMSVIWNWSLPDLQQPTADYDGSAGRPSIYRTDSILKAIGKASVTRGYDGSEKIPFVIVGNTPPPTGYRDKIDKTVTSGLIQKWISLTPSPLIVEPNTNTNARNPKNTTGFLRIDSFNELQKLLVTLLSGDWCYVSNMVDPTEVGRIIKSLDLNRPPEEIGQEFLCRLPESSTTSKI